MPRRLRQRRRPAHTALISQELGRSQDRKGKALYEEDESLPLRKSQDNPFVKKLYEEYLGHPGSEKAHKLLHTHYTPRENYPGKSDSSGQSQQVQTRQYMKAEC